MFLFTKEELDDEIGWHSEEYYNETLKFCHSNKMFNQIWANIFTLTWGYNITFLKGG